MTERRTPELHAHRWSAPEVRYFVTVCTSDHRPGLMATATRELLFRAAQRSDTLQDTSTFAFTVMPDHLHWLFQLGHRLSLGRIVARFKADTHAGLAAAGLRWQRDFFERRLREEESVEDYGRYIFLNPYQAGLLTPSEGWTGWWCPRPGQLEFLARLNPDGSIPREWLDAKGEIEESGIQTGRD